MVIIANKYHHCFLEQPTTTSVNNEMRNLFQSTPSPSHQSLLSRGLSLVRQNSSPKFFDYTRDVVPRKRAGSKMPNKKIKKEKVKMEKPTSRPTNQAIR